MMLRACLYSTAFVLTAVPALADITADDVWENMTAYYGAWGGELSGIPQRNGDVVTIVNNNMQFEFPLEFGQLSVAMPSLTLTEMDDGTVRLNYPDTFSVAVAATITGEGSATGQVQVSFTDASFVASGTHGDITYHATIESLGYELVEFALPEVDITALTLSGRVDGSEITSRVSEGILLTVTTESYATTTELEYSYDLLGRQTTSNTKYGARSGSTSFSMPRDGVDMMNLTPAFSAGMALDATMSAGLTTTHEQVMQDGEEVSATSMLIQSGNSTLQLSAEGFYAESTTEGVAFSLNDSEILPFPINVEFTNLIGEFAFPIMASDVAQDAQYRVEVRGLRMAPAIWALFDSDKNLPRGPADIVINLGAQILTDVDLFDFEKLQQLFSTGEFGVEIESVEIEDITLSAMGASVDGAGSFVFDYSDLESFYGFPRPEGSASISYSGVNALIDTLVDAGILPDQQASMGRLGLGMFAQVIGEDLLTSRVEIDSEGHVNVNGQRIK